MAGSKWLDEERELLAQVWPYLGKADVLRKFRESGFNRSIVQLDKAARRFGIRKTPEGIRSSLAQRHDILTHTPVLDQIDWLPTYDKFITVRSDCAVVCSDLHIPYLDKDFFDKMCVMANRFQARDCIIAGDLFDQTMFSFFIRYLESGLETWEFQMEVASEVLRKLLDNFEFVYATKGNHDNRLIKMLLGKVRLEHIFKWMTSYDPKRVKVSDYPFCELLSGSTRVRCTHAKSYSRHATIVSKQLSAKEECSVINAGGHLAGISGSMSGRWVADIGGMYNKSQIEYVNTTDTTHPKWNPSFIIVKDGMPFTFFKHWSHWDYWLS